MLREFRLNYWYQNVYLLWINTIFNIVLPVVSMIVLNTLVTRKIKEFLRNLDSSTEVRDMIFLTPCKGRGHVSLSAATVTNKKLTVQID